MADRMALDTNAAAGRVRQAAAAVRSRSSRLRALRICGRVASRPAVGRRWLAGFALLAWACGSGGSGGGEPGVGAGGEGSGEGPGATSTFTAGDETRVVRLTHRQYENTVLDLLGVEETPASEFAPDSLAGFPFDTSGALEVDQRLGPQYRRAAEQLAELVVGDEELLSALLPCDAAEVGCSTEFIAQFGERAFRRPLREEERMRLASLFAAGPELVASGDDFSDGVRVTLEAVLQSPQFLYRTETSQAAVVEGRQWLSGWEVASRLSYFLWDSMPDEALFERARQGQLASEDGVVEEAARMLADPRAVEKLVSLHEQSWQYGRISSIAPNRDVYPEAPPDMVERVQRSTSAFYRDVVESDGGLYEFFNAAYAYVDSALAPIFGVEVEGEELVRIEFDPAERKGFLMQPGFLAANAYAVKPDSIHRGLFVIRDVLCRTIPDPPPGAQGTPPPETDQPIITNRDEVALLTSRDLCQNCHSQINPPGFAFEGFDAIGRIRTEDNGAPVDTTGEMRLDGEALSFAGPHELVEALAQSEEARACYAQRWLEFAQGRELGEEDEIVRDRLSRDSIRISEIVAEVVKARAFRSRDAKSPTSDSEVNP